MSTSSNPFRLKAGFTCTSTSDVACHAGKNTRGGDALPYNSLTTHSAAAMTASGYTTKRGWAYAPNCVNCHDPHGDANAALMQSDLRKSSSFTVPVVPPTLPTADDIIVFTDRTAGATTAGNSYSDLDSPFASICQSCHMQTVGFVRNTSGSYAGHPGGVGGNPGDCSACHKHDSAFKPSGSNGCHGDPAEGNYWPDQATTPDTAGAHLSHMAFLAQKVYGQTISALLADAGCRHQAEDAV